MTDMGVSSGITLDTASRKLFDYLLDAQTNVPALFIDSGAFSEKSGKPFTHSVWHTKLSKYEVLIEKYGRRCVFVAPDKVGDQEESINRLNTYSDILMNLMRKSSMIVPLQKGSLTQAEMYNFAVTLFGQDIVAGIPFKKSATSYYEYLQFMRSTNPPFVHILGVTPFGTRWREINKINKEFTCTKFSFDGCRIRSLIGKERAYTLGMKKRKHLPRAQAIYETLMELKDLFTIQDVKLKSLPLFEGFNI